MRTKILLGVGGVGILMVGAMLWMFGGMVRERNARRIESAKTLSEAPAPEAIVGGGVVTFGKPAQIPGAPRPTAVGDAEFRQWITREAKT